MTTGSLEWLSAGLVTPPTSLGAERVPSAAALPRPQGPGGRGRGPRGGLRARGGVRVPGG